MEIMRVRIITLHIPNKKCDFCAEMLLAGEKCSVIDQDLGDYFIMHTDCLKKLNEKITRTLSSDG